MAIQIFVPWSAPRHWSQALDFDQQQAHGLASNAKILRRSFAAASRDV